MMKNLKERIAQMALLEWNDKLVIGISRIDNQHKELIRIVNELHEAMKSGKGNEDNSLSG